jgi:hypothetical protein
MDAGINLKDFMVSATAGKVNNNFITGKINIFRFDS